MDIREKIEQLPDEDYITLIHHNGQAETSFPAKELKQVVRLPGDKNGTEWMAGCGWCGTRSNVHIDHCPYPGKQERVNTSK